MKTTTYAKLAESIEMVMHNDILQKAFDFEPVSEEGEEGEIYQTFIIGIHDANYLLKNTYELVYYSEELNMYVWAITHFGTPWSIVELTLK